MWNPILIQIRERYNILKNVIIPSLVTNFVEYFNEELCRLFQFIPRNVQRNKVMSTMCVFVCVC
jgi:hypothetical protein